ncbi:helix-turn-helix domain-containing protein [Desulfofundulus sp.]|uniref:helix-turn-helix domain-containing protein n=1 Tax=Desulfofundulus sp. TaxID=2282750 RepID=UPI003C754A91
MVISLEKYRKTRQLRASVEITIGERVAIARKDQGLTQEELGWRVGYSQSVISRMETGAAEITPGDMAAIAKALGNPALLETYCSTCPVCRAAVEMSSWPKPAA